MTSSSSFFITRKEINMKKLDQLRQESKEIKDKIDDTEERLRQLKNQQRQKNLKKHYDAEDLVGKNLLAIINLQQEK